MNKESGFTLIEVLVATFIISITILTSVSSISNILNITHYNKLKPYAVWCAENNIIQFKLKNNVAYGEYSEKCSQNGVDFDTIHKITKTENPKFKNIEIKVQYNDVSLLNIIYLHHEK